MRAVEQRNGTTRQAIVTRLKNKTRPPKLPRRPRKPGWSKRVTIQPGGRRRELMASLPTLVVYILLGRYFIRGLMAGALKG